MLIKQYNIIRYGKMPKAESIDMEATGRKLKRMIKKSGYTVKEIQEYLNLSCPQPIYRWCKGTVLPSIDHLYSLSKLFRIHMEDMLVPVPNRENEVHLKYGLMARLYSYAERIKSR